MIWLRRALSGLLALTVARRWLFTAVALARPVASGALSAPPPGGLPTLLVLVPVRNEESMLPGLLDALDRQDYPRGRLTIALVDDASDDRAPTLMDEWAAERSHVRVVRLPQRQGKAAALNAALAELPPTEILAVYDADERPRTDALLRLALALGDPRVGAVSGRRRVANPYSPASAYAAFEAVVHQLITARAKDRLGLAPPILGSNCAYRRAALAEVGSFRPGAFLEDTDLTARLARAGWTLRFVPEAVSEHDAPTTVTGYYRQHARWASGFNEVARAQMGAILRSGRLPLPHRLELAVFSLGYLDRLLLTFVAALPLMGRSSRFTRPLVLAALLTPLAQVAAALRLDRAPASQWLRIVWMPLLFLADIVAAAAGLAAALRPGSRRWEERADRT